MKFSALGLSTLVLLTSALVACSSGTTSTAGGSDTDGGSTETPADGTADSGAPKAQKDAAPDDTKPEEEAVPTKPFVELKINGAVMKVKDVKVTPTNIYPSQGTSYYEIKATLEQTPPMVAGLDADPSISIRVGKDEKGTDACKEKRGPQEGFVEPVLELREVQINYRRFTGSSTVIAAPTTKKSGACSMKLKSAATAGQAWGEATGSVQSGTDEPELDFEVKWFQTFTWQ